MPASKSAASPSVAPTASAGKRGATSSPWSSEESREFLQERLSRFAQFVAGIAGAFFVGSWIIGLVWDPSSLEHGLPIRAWAFFHLGGVAVAATVWLATRGGPLPAPVLRVVESAGIFLLSVAMLGRAASLPVVLRPDLMATLALFALLLYRAAIVPSEPHRTAVLGAVAVAPLPVMTYLVYAHARHPDLPTPWAYTAFAFLFAVLAVVLSTTISRVIYGLRQTVKEARRLGPYTLVTKIGEGGMGAVYRAQHALLKRPTAVKILPPERAGQMDLARFEREVQMTSLLTSPHIVSIYDYGRTPDGLFYYAMEYLDGIDLNELVRREGPMPPGRVIRILRQVSEALAEAHREGLIHRDIKPANILLTERGGKPDFAKVVDFGLVKSVTGAAAGMTADDVVLGTPYYMAPETLRSPDRIDARSDLYSLGATGYFLLTGKAVFEGPSADVFASLLRDAPEPPSKRLGRALPASLEALILKTLAKDPGERPESVEAFDAALAACADVPAWTDAEASAWWRSRRRLIEAARAGRAAESATLVVTRGAERAEA
jgi:eukaryotic-like serine/threonine-protein kinase